jgi:TupA-like ATPgrasp
MLTYLWRHGRLPELRHPKLFTELVQHRKLYDRDARMPLLADKVLAKDFAATRLSSDWIIPTLYHGDVLPERPAWPAPFVIKSRHGCNQSAFVRDESVDWDLLQRRAARWMRRDYGRWLDEWLYRCIPHGILVEPFVGGGTTLPIDWKFFVFGGRVRYVQIHLDRETDHRWIVMDRDWKRVSSPSRDIDPQPPETLGRMIDAAEKLGRDMDFVRVDLYEVAGQPLFGELTFYPGSGLDRFDPPSLDGAMGREWLRAAFIQSISIDSNESGICAPVQPEPLFV